METQHTIDRVTAIAGRVLRVPAASLDAAASRDTLPFWDSILHLNLILAVEEEFGIEFGDGQIMSLASIAEIARAVIAMLATEDRD